MDILMKVAIYLGFKLFENIMDILMKVAIIEIEDT
jgi:hypothetical protein